MRVLICDQETEMLERIARSFEVDVATSKATCIDLMRANPFDVLVASERLTDGSGLELLSHVATRWPETLRVLVIEPARLKMLRGKLAAFRLDATLPYPLDEDDLERTLERLQHDADDDGEAPEAEEPPPPPPPVQARRPSAPAETLKVQKVQLPQQPARISSANARMPQQPPGGRPAGPSRPPTGGGRSREFSQGRQVLPPADKPVRRKLGNYTPLGAPEDEQLRIVEREFDQTMAPLAARAIRSREEANRPRTPKEKLERLAGHVTKRLRRLLKK